MASNELQKLVPGDRVRVRVYGGDTVIRSVIAVKEKVVVICCDEEYLQADEEGRQPNGIGFPHADVIETVGIRPVALIRRFP